MVIRMKKNFIFYLLISIIIGFISAQIVYNSYKSNILQNSYNAYLVKVSGIENNDEYYIFDGNDDTSVVGITTNLLNANKIKQLYKTDDNSVYIKPIVIENDEFVSSLEQYDILISEVDDKKNIISINDAILSSYKELILNSEN